MVAKIRFSIAAPLALALLAGGCNEHLGRRDSATSFAGDAKAANAAIHTIDPWPRHAENTQIGMDGIRAQKVIENYHRGPPVPTQQPMQLSLTPAAAPGGPSKTD